MRLRHRFFVSAIWVPLLAALSVCSPLWSSAAHAQSDQILVVSGSDVPEALEEDVTEALDKVGSVISPSSYVGNLRARKQAPDSEEALTKLAPQIGATLIVVLQISRHKLEVTFRNGHTGRVIDEETVPARGKRPKLGGPARRKLASAAKRVMSKVGPAPSSTPAAAERSYPQDTVAKSPTRTSASAAPQRPAPPARPQPQTEEEEEEEEASDEPEEGSDDSAEEAPAAEQPKSADQGIAFLLSAGGGLGSRSILVPTSPTRAGGNQIETSFAPALEIGVGVEFALSDSLLLRLGGAYRTIFGLNAAYFDATGQVASSALSSHGIVVGADLGYLTNGPDSLGLHVFLGWAYRGMSAAAPNLPSASIQGPALRPELHIPLGKGVVTLRIAPELILVIDADATLPANVAGLQSVGFAYGGEASIDFRISSSFGLGIQFRESRALVPSGWGTSAIENERFIIGRVNLRL